MSAPKIEGGPHDGAEIWRDYEFKFTSAGIALALKDAPPGCDEAATGWTFARDAAMAISLIMDRAGYPKLSAAAKALVEQIHAESEVDAN